MTWKDIHVDDYGWIGKLTLQQDGAAVDISSYTTKQFVLRDPDGTAATKTADFDSDGTDGVLKYTVATGDIDAAGNWKVAARIKKANVELTSEGHGFNVAARLD